MFLGIDWGGTYIKAGVVNKQNKIVKKVTFRSREFQKKEVFINQLKQLIVSFGKFNLEGIGIGAPGIIDTKKGFIYYLPNIRGWENFPLGEVIYNELKIPAAVDNDANVFALAEARIGAAKGKKEAIFLTLGTGLGGAVIVDGRILKGRTSAGELGHVPVQLEGKSCGCGGKGCIESYVGNKYLLERYKHIKGSRILVSEVKDIYEKAVEGEKEALYVWREFSRNLGMFLSGMINIFNPEVIVLGGGISGAFRLFKPLLWQVINKQAMWPHLKDLEIVKAKIKNAGIIGAALLIREKVSYSQ